MDLYDILNIPRNASLEEIKTSYRKLAQIHHPDKGGNEELFKAIKNAYEILSDPERRNQYDTIGDMNSVSDPRVEALNEIIKCLQSILPNLNIQNDNILECMKRSICERRGQLTRDQEIFNNAINNCTLLTKRFKYKINSNGNIISNFFKEQINARRSDLARVTRQIEIMDLMLKILEDYEFVFE